MVPHSNTHKGGNTGGVKGMVVGSLKSRRTRERVLALTAALWASWGCSWERRHFVLARQRCLGGTKRLPAKRFTGAPSRALPPPLDDVWQGLIVGVCLCDRPIVSVGSCRHTPLIGYQPCPAGAQPTGGALSHRTLRLAAGASLARSDLPHSPGLPSPQPNRPSLLTRSSARRQI